jgi:hypothetical protein
MIVKKVNSQFIEAGFGKLSNEIKKTVNREL